MKEPPDYLRVPGNVAARRDLSGNAKLAFGYIRFRLNIGEHPGARDVARRIGTDVKTARKCIGDLTAGGLMTVEAGPAGRSNRYTLTGGETGPVEKLDRDRSGDSPSTGGAAGPGPIQELPHHRRKKKSGRKEGKGADLFGDTPAGGNGQGEKTRGKSWTAEDVEGIYEAYPRHEGAGKARKAIAKALERIAKRLAPGADPVAWLTDRVRAFAQSPKGKAGKYTPYPATWMSEERYDDDERCWYEQNGDGRGTNVARVHSDPGRWERVAEFH